MLITSENSRIKALGFIIKQSTENSTRGDKKEFQASITYQNSPSSAKLSFISLFSDSDSPLHSLDL